MLKRIDKDTIQIDTMRIRRPLRLIDDPDGFVGCQKCQTLENGKWKAFVTATKSQAGFDRKVKEFKDLARKAGKEKNGLCNNAKTR